MDEMVFADYGIEIFKRNGRYYIRYDEGHFAIQMREDEITEGEALKAQNNEKDAYEVLLACERRRVNGTKL